MANLILRQTPGGEGNTTKNAPLTNAEMDANLIGLNNDIASRATIASPALSGIPTAPTALQNSSSTQIATTAFVKSVVSSDALALTIALG